VARRVTVASTVVSAHLLTSAAHGVVHGIASVPLSGPQQAFVVAIVGVAPLVALGLMWQRRERAGLALLAASLAGSLCFGVAFHFVLSTPDHVHAVAGRWRVPFGATASLVALADALGLGIMLSSVDLIRKSTAPTEA
jgi:Na+(H+)/acetate symporter ActP